MTQFPCLQYIAPQGVEKLNIWTVLRDLWKKEGIEMPSVILGQGYEAKPKSIIAGGWARNLQNLFSAAADTDNGQPDGFICMVLRRALIPAQINRISLLHISKNTHSWPIFHTSNSQQSFPPCSPNPSETDLNIRDHKWAHSNQFPRVYNNEGMKGGREQTKSLCGDAGSHWSLPALTLIPFYGFMYIT